jgi:hypothetical protein
MEGRPSAAYILSNRGERAARLLACTLVPREQLQAHEFAGRVRLLWRRASLADEDEEPTRVYGAGFSRRRRPGASTRSRRPRW